MSNPWDRVLSVVYRMKLQFLIYTLGLMDSKNNAIFFLKYLGLK